MDYQTTSKNTSSNKTIKHPGHQKCPFFQQNPKTYPILTLCNSIANEGMSMPGNRKGEKTMRFEGLDDPNEGNSALDSDPNDAFREDSSGDLEITSEKSSLLARRKLHQNRQNLIPKDHDYIVIHDAESNDESYPHHNRRFKAHGQADSLPVVVIYAFLPQIKKPLINLDQFNTAEEKLDLPKIKQAYYNEGISVIAPHSGQHFTLREDRTLHDEKGVTSASYTFRGLTSPSDDNEIALTVMNMIENVISKGNPLNLRTNNPFVAQITKLYVEELGKAGLEIIYTPPENINLNDSKNSNAISRANDVFGNINTEMKIETLNTSTPKPPWYAAAMEACKPEPTLKPRF